MPHIWPNGTLPPLCTISVHAGLFVERLAGSFTGVMGLPVFETAALLREAGADVPPF